MKNYKHFREEDKKILKIDLDMPSKKKAVDLLSERLAYMSDLNFLEPKSIRKIELVRKTKYGAKIYLRKPISIYLLIILQLMLGSDYRKEVNTMINFFKIEMKYFNRLFSIKMYKGGKIMGAEFIDVTQEVFKYISNTKRKKNMN